MERENNITIKPYDWMIPMYGNKHSIPYGWLSVKGTLNNGQEVDVFVKTKGDLYTDHSPHQYVIINKQRYIVRNEGSLYHPKIYLIKWEKEKINGKWMYV